VTKILVEVAVPAAGLKRDLFIPFELRLAEIAELVKVVFAGETGDSFAPVADTLLCEAGSGVIYDVDKTPEELGLENGSRLLLI
jgi:hypothetical protein